MDSDDHDTSAGYLVLAHGYNGDYQFTEPWSHVDTLAQAKAIASDVMQSGRLSSRLPDGTPTIRWMEIFGPGIEESIGLEERDGALVWTP